MAYTIYKLLPFFLLGVLSVFVFYQFKLISLNIEEISWRNRKVNKYNLFNHPHVDTSSKLTESEILDQLESRLQNLPVSLWKKLRNKSASFNSTCAKFPDLFNLDYNNLYWQTLSTSNGTFQLFGSYLDNRKNNRLGPTVRILGMVDRIEPSVTTYCQIWFDDETKPVIVKTIEYKYIWNKQWGTYQNGVYQPYLLACVMPKKIKHKTPQSISLVENQCDNARNNLKVVYNKAESKKNFAVCVKGLDFPDKDLSIQLAEWIELLNILGAEKLFIYDLQVHPNVSKLLKYYEKVGKVEVTPLTLAGGQPNLPPLQHLYLSKNIVKKRFDELIPYNDCFYKHMYKYNFVAVLDIDEVIMPTEDNNWHQLMDKVLTNANDSASYNVRNVYFFGDLMSNKFKDIPGYLHMLQHVYRAKKFTQPGYYVKCFHNTEKVLTLHNHFPLACLGSVCSSYSIKTNEAQLNHYRADCVDSISECSQFKNDSVRDTTIWRFKDEIVERVTNVLKELNYFK